MNSSSPGTAAAAAANTTTTGGGVGCCSAPDEPLRRRAGATPAAPTAQRGHRLASRRALPDDGAGASSSSGYQGRARRKEDLGSGVGFLVGLLGLLKSRRGGGGSYSPAGASASRIRRPLALALASTAALLVLASLLVYGHDRGTGTTGSFTGGNLRGGTKTNDAHDEPVGEQQRQQQPLLYVASLVRDPSKIHADVAGTLAELNCLHGVRVHVIAGSPAGIDDFRGKFDELRARRVLSNQRRARRDQRREEDVDDERIIASKKLSEEEIADIVSANCQSVTIVPEDPVEIYGSVDRVPANRIDRIAALRDYQRELLRPMFLASSAAASRNIEMSGRIRNGVVMVIDLDLAAIGPVDSVIVPTMLALSKPSTVTGHVDGQLQQEQPQVQEDDYYPHDVVCAAGITMANHAEPSYYDTYATVLLPDTFVHPLKRRLIKRYYSGEDPRLVRSDDRKGNFTQADLMRYLRAKGGESKRGTVPVRSCFGGAAMYRSAVWFREDCSYGGGGGRGMTSTGSSSTPDQDHGGSGGEDGDELGLFRYASEADGRPCEHVVFHDCLGRRRSSSLGGGGDGGVGVARVAVHPDFITLWKKDR